MPKWCFKDVGLQLCFQGAISLSKAHAFSELTTKCHPFHKSAVIVLFYCLYYLHEVYLPVSIITLISHIYHIYNVLSLSIYVPFLSSVCIPLEDRYFNTFFFKLVYIVWWNFIHKCSRNMQCVEVSYKMNGSLNLWPQTLAFTFILSVCIVANSHKWFCGENTKSALGSFKNIMHY